MSSTGVRDQNSNDKRIIKGLILNETQFIQSLRVFANTSTLSGLGSIGGDSNNSPNEPSGNYFAKSGDVFLGQIGNSFDTIAATNIASGVLDVSKTSGTTFPVVILQGETPPDPDDLVTIVQGSDVFPFQELVIRTRSSIITVKNSDNINTPDGNDLVLPVGSIIHLYFDTFLGEWVLDGGTPFFSGGGGISFPIKPPIDNRGTVSTNQAFTLSNTTGHVLKFIAAGNFDVTFSAFPASDIQQEWEVEVIQDATGGRVVSFPQVINPPTLDTTPNTTTIIVFRTNDGGVTIRVGNTVTTTSGGGGEFFGPWTADHDAGLQDLINLANIDFNGTSATIEGLSNLQFFQTAHSINSLSGEMDFQVNTTDFFRFIAGGAEIARFEDIATILALDMKDHTIKNAKDIRFDVASSFTTPSNIPGIGFDAASNSFKFNVPAGKEFDLEFNGVKIYDFTIARLSAPSVTIAQDINLNDSTTDPTVNGQFRRNVNDVKVFSGGAVRNLSNIGAGSPLTTKGDIFGFDTNNQRIPVGSNGQVLTANSAVALGVEWAAGGGATNIISQGDSNVTVTDTGTGLVTTTVDSLVRFQVQANRADLFGIDLFGLETLNFDSTVGASTITPSVLGVIWNFPDVNDIFNLNFNSVKGFQVDLLRTRVFSNTPTLTGAAISIFRDDSSPGADDELGTISFDGRDSAANFTTYAKITSEIVSSTTTAEIGRLRWSVLNAGILVNAMTLSPGNLTHRHFAGGATDKAIFHLLKEDATPSSGDSIGAIDFDLLDSPTTINYARIEGLIDNTTNSGSLFLKVLADSSLIDVFKIEGRSTTSKADIKILDQTIIKATSGEIGLFVTNDPSDLDSIGSSGTLQIPRTSINPTTLNDLNTRFGNFDGAFGVATGLTERLWVRISSSRWIGFDFDAAITS